MGLRASEGSGSQILLGSSGFEEASSMSVQPQEFSLWVKGYLRDWPSASRYTPVCVAALPAKSARDLLTWVWTGALLGVLHQVVSPKSTRWISCSIYVLLGWAAAAYAGELYTNLTRYWSPGAYAGVVRKEDSCGNFPDAWLKFGSSCHEGNHQSA